MGKSSDGRKSQLTNVSYFHRFSPPTTTLSPVVLRSALTRENSVSYVGTTDRWEVGGENGRDGRSGCVQSALSISYIEGETESSCLEGNKGAEQDKNDGAKAKERGGGEFFVLAVLEVFKATANRAQNCRASRKVEAWVSNKCSIHD
jgi:hypothetical protein